MTHGKLDWYLGYQVPENCSATLSYTNLLFPLLMSDFRGHGWTVIRPNFNLFWNSKECIHLTAAYSHFLKITPLCSIPGKSFIYPQREQGLPQGSITLLTEHILEALFHSWKIFNLLHPSNLGWWRHVLTDRIPRILLAVLIKRNEEASKKKSHIASLVEFEKSWSKSNVC